MDKVSLGFEWLDAPPSCREKAVEWVYRAIFEGRRRGITRAPLIKEVAASTFLVSRREVELIFNKVRKQCSKCNLFTRAAAAAEHDGGAAFRELMASLPLDVQIACKSFEELDQSTRERVFASVMAKLSGLADMADRTKGGLN